MYIVKHIALIVTYLQFTHILNSFKLKVMLGLYILLLDDCGRGLIHDGGGVLIFFVQDCDGTGDSKKIGLTRI